MNWFLLAAVGPVLWSISNHIDKFVISRYFKAGGLGSIVLLTCIFQTGLLPFIYFFNQGVFHIIPFHAFILASFGGLAMFQLMIYFYALKEDSASVVVPLFQIVPVLTY